MAYRVDTTDHGGRTVYTLRDEATGSMASVLPSYGFNLFDLRLPAAGEVRRLVVAADDFPDNPTSPGRNGTPVLFPFPNRIRDGKYSFGGKSYAIPVGTKTHAIHGFAIAAKWEVLEQGATADEAFIVGRFQLSEHAPESRPLWPTDAELTIRYALAGRKLTMTIEVENPTDQDLPYGFGIHPYFRVPFTTKNPEDGRVILPATEYWPLEGYLPTGERKPVDARLDFRQGQSMAGQKLDDVLTGLEFVGGRCVCRLVDAPSKAEFRLGFDDKFRELVVFTPPFGEGTLIAIEPYTQTTDAINLEARGVDAGLRVLGHGESETMTITMETVG
jgi:aldose 1-epimerase